MAIESVPTRLPRRTDLISCDRCGKPLTFTHRHSTTEREFGFASFAYVLCGGCCEADRDSSPEEKRNNAIDAILNRAERQSLEWRDAVAKQIGRGI